MLSTLELNKRKKRYLALIEGIEAFKKDGASEVVTYSEVLNLMVSYCQKEIKRIK